MNGNEPAFPIPASDLTGSYDAAQGLTKREHFAAMAMQSMCAGPGAEMVASRDGRYDETNWKEIVAMNAVEFADALIAELNRSKAEEPTQ
jgi:hypothetical protein